jgi:RNA polymerase sigma-70 factor (ECF subfamily)
LQDKKLFEQIYKEHYAGLMHFATGWLGVESDAHEVVQEIFISVWEKGDDLNWDIGLKAYLYRSVKNRCFNLNRDRKITVDVEDQKEHIQSKVASPDQGLLDEDFNTRVNKAIESLPTRCRQVFLLKRREGFSQKEIAELMDTTEKTVENQMSKAMKILREKIKVGNE